MQLAIGHSCQNQNTCPLCGFNQFGKEFETVVTAEKEVQHNNVWPHARHLECLGSIHRLPDDTQSRLVLDEVEQSCQEEFVIINKNDANIQCARIMSGGFEHVPS